MEDQEKYPMDFGEIAKNFTGNASEQKKLKLHLREAYLTGHIDGRRELIESLDLEIEGEIDD